MKTNIKIFFCVLFTAVFVFAAQIAVFADNGGIVLRFDQNQTFTILHMTDWHTAYPMQATQKQYAIEALSAASPDLVVLGGDMSEASRDDQPNAVKEICDLFVQAKTPFAITFGNHDYLHEMSIDELFSLYQKYGGEYCVGADDYPELFGCGTCSIPIYAHGENRIAYNIYCFDSGCEVPGGYDSIHTDQIEWYRQKAQELKEHNGGEFVPSVVFQHIIPQEICSAFFPEAKPGESNHILQYETVSYKLMPIPNLSCIRDGYIMERPCPGFYNHGQMTAMRQNGDVRAIFCGHDHSNSFTVEIDGIDVVNTPSVKPHSIMKKINWGARIVTLHEDGSYESNVLLGSDLAAKKGSQLVPIGAISYGEIIFTKIWKAFADASMVFWKLATKVFW